MALWMSITAGLALLVVGGEVLVRGAAGAAARLGVSPLMIGLTLVGFGTSAPELAASLQAALTGSPGMAVGTVVGSNIANALLILGAAALVSPIAVNARAYRRDGTALSVATAAMVFAVLMGTISRAMGFAALAMLVLYVLYVWSQERTRPGPEGDRHSGQTRARAGSRWPLVGALLMALVGIGLTVWGARLLVDGSVALARGFGVSDTLIGLTVVAVGTSLPELVTSVVAAARGQGDVALGNVIGSNLYNVLGILGFTAVVRPLPVDPAIARLDIWVFVAATAAMLIFARRRGQVTRGEGALLVAGYGAYVGWLAYTA